jgi:hypothetical protein
MTMKRSAEAEPRKDSVVGENLEGDAGAPEHRGGTQLASASPRPPLQPRATSPTDWSTEMGNPSCLYALPRLTRGLATWEHDEAIMVHGECGEGGHGTGAPERSSRDDDPVAVGHNTDCTEVRARVRSGLQREVDGGEAWVAGPGGGRPPTLWGNPSWIANQSPAGS